MVLDTPREYPGARKGFELLFPSIPFQAQAGIEVLDAVDHGLEPNQKVRVKPSTAGLGLIPQTDYYVESVDKDKVKLSRDSGPGSAVTMAGSGIGYLLTWPQTPVFRKLEGGAVKPKLVEEAGKLIFQALGVHPAIDKALTQALIDGRKAAGAVGGCIPIGLLLGPMEADNIPWEMLHVPQEALADPETLPFLALSPLWPIVRLKDLPSVH